MKTPKEIVDSLSLYYNITDQHALDIEEMLVKYLAEAEALGIEKGQGLVKREQLLEMHEQGKKAGRDEAFASTPHVNSSPMGLSTWMCHGKKYKYWDYFMKEFLKDVRGCVPPAKEPLEIDPTYDYPAGWNNCRTQTLQNMEALLKDKTV